MYIWEDKKANYRHNYGKIAEDLNEAEQRNDHHTVRDIIRNFAGIDLFFFLYFVCNRVDINEPWLVDRCNEVQDEHEHTLDIWARFHYKSTIITFALILQDIINFPEESNVIFSHTRHNAKDFLREIKMELQKNPIYPFVWPEIFYSDPERNSPKWSEDVGLLVKRRTSRKELTLEAWGLVDGMPTGKHYNRRVYDDLVTEKSVNTPDQIDKLLDSWEKSQMLKDRYGTERMCGTYYHFDDLYHHIGNLGVYKLRLYPGREGQSFEGKPVFLTDGELNSALKKMGPFNFACQVLLNPVASDKKLFEYEWLQFYKELPKPLNKYIIVDSADQKKKDSDFTVMAVIGLDKLKNYYLVDMIRDKFNLAERWTALRKLMEKHPGVIRVYYEKYGKDAETAYMREQMNREGFYFNIEDIGGVVSKIERIKMMQAPFFNKEFYLPIVLMYKNIKGQERDLIQDFIQEEYTKLPFAKHDDMIDCIARIKDPKFVARFPKGDIKEAPKVVPKWNPLQTQTPAESWMIQ